MTNPTNILYEHEDGRYAINPDTTGEPRWHRLGPVDVSALAAPVQAVPAWTCFHCNATFTTPESAQEHFGRTEYQAPGCQINLAEYRKMEEICRRHCEEDTDLHRQIHAAQAASAENARRAEETGYARGLEDAKKHPEELGLMQASPAAVAGPSDEELMALSKKCMGMSGGLGMHYANYARAVLARWGAAPVSDEAPDYAGENVAERKAAIQRIFSAPTPPDAVVHVEKALRALHRPAAAPATQAAAEQEPIAVVTKFTDWGGEIEWTRRVIAPVGAKLCLAGPAEATGKACLQVTQPAAPATTGAAPATGEYPPLPGKEIPSYSQDLLMMVRASELHAYADATCAMRAYNRLRDIQRDGWNIEFATACELEAYEHACLSLCASVLKILDGKDHGQGLNNEPWGTVRKRLLALVGAAQSAPAAQARDAARLDHLQQTGSTIDLLPGEGDFYPMRFRVGGLHAAVSTNVRTAIDAAIAQAKGGEAA
ncbi:hypothetical protein GCM10027082_23990 [Comamonas humi]